MANKTKLNGTYCYGNSIFSGNSRIWFNDWACFVEACILCYEGMFLSFLPKGLVQRLAVWLVADFEALSCQVTTAFNTSCAARIPTAPAINYTACCAFGFYFFHLLIVNWSKVTNFAVNYLDFFHYVLQQTLGDYLSDRQSQINFP